MSVSVSAFVIILILSIGLPVLAQETVTYNDVIRVAERMYCPICENEPLDECRNATCLEWKDEIYRRLEEGQSDQDIIDYFVTRYGQKVVGIPQDTVLRWLSFAGPILGTLIAIAIGWFTFRRWLRHTPLTEKVDATDTIPSGDDDYRSQLERDLTG
ncbi:MAG: cytochrome c-type biogenesis protein CcmH [Anaerolineae bacterium]|nr:cytochrome c-type biogenesis protein CcmH [Anaerolineae bacterium]MDQ7034491.1 cytochrome c-type biogenesis protein CcmH [Anaerolineae bacterium]